jgi:hypothetical protein
VYYLPNNQAVFEHLDLSFQSGGFFLGLLVEVWVEHCIISERFDLISFRSLPSTQGLKKFGA